MVEYKKVELKEVVLITGVKEKENILAMGQSVFIGYFLSVNKINRMRYKEYAPIERLTYDDAMTDGIRLLNDYLESNNAIINKINSILI